VSDSALCGQPPAPAARTALETQVRAAQAELTFDRSRSTNLASVPFGLIVTWLLWPSADQRLLAAWMAATLAVTLWRLRIAHGFDRDRPARVLHWTRRFEWALVADGTLYGLLGTVLLPRNDAILAVEMVAALIGLTAIGLVVLSTSLRATLARTVPLLVPPLLWHLAQGDRIAVFSGLGMAAFLGLSVLEGRRASEHTRNALRLRLQMDELAAQRQQALALAEHSSAAKSQFLATMSHEVRTPLHGILGLARLLCDDTALRDPAVRRQRLHTLERTGEHLLGIINDVLDYSRVEGRHLQLQPQPFDLHALVDEVADLCRVAALAKGLTLQAEQALPQPCPVQGDPARVRQVLLNLTGNAVKFTARGGVTVRSSRDAGGAVTIRVVDSGPGVPEDARDRIFDPFEQLDGSFARRHGGTGLGLAISRELARAMGGDLVCLGPAGGGATFELTLPLPAVAPAAADVTAPTPAPARAGAPLHGRVLLAEDNPVNAIVAEAALQRLGIEVVTVADGEQAAARAARERFDLVLMDCQMPGLDGFEATARIRRGERERGHTRVPIVALTANALQGDRERSLAAGMDEHLAKPYHDADLRAVLERYLAA
jgi:signal transduction histidine kinase